MSLDRRWSNIEGVLPDYWGGRGAPGTPGNPLRGEIVAAVAVGLGLVAKGGVGATVITVATNVAIAAGSVIYSSQAAKKAKKKAAEQARRAALAAEAAAKRARKLRKQQRFKAFSSDEPKGSALNVTVVDPVAPRRILYGETRTGGVKVFAHTHTDNRKLLMVILLGDGPVDSVQKIFFDDEEATLTASSTLDHNETASWETPGAFIWFHDGSAGQLANSYIRDKAPAWTDDHTLDGIAYIAVQLDYNLDIWTNGVPNISAVVRGRSDIEDPRDGTTGYTDNAALCYAHYLKQEWAGLAAESAEIDETSLVAAANVCDEDVPLAAGGTEARYRVSGMVALDRNPEDIMADFEAAMAGGAPYIGGAYRIYAGAYVPPTTEIDEDWMRGAVSIQKRRGRASRANYVKGAYRAATANYELEDFPARTDAAFVTADGARHVRDLPLALVSSGSQAQRLAEIELQTSRLEEDLALTCDLRALRVNAGSTVAVTLSRHGITSRPYHVQTWELAVGDGGEPVVRLGLTRTASSVYDWTASDEIQVVPAAAIDTGKPIVATPTFTDPAGEYPTSDFDKPITIATTTAGATIRYSTESIPSGIDTGTAYTIPVDVGINDVLYARAFADGYIPSVGAIGIWTAEVVAEPVASPVGADYDSGDYPVAVTLTCETSGASIYYTTDGSTPDATDTLYTVPVNVTEGQTLKAIGIKTDSVDSTVMSESYT